MQMKNADVNANESVECKWNAGTRKANLKSIRHRKRDAFRVDRASLSLFFCLLYYR